MPPAQNPSPPIVGIGASAGGLEAFEQFFRQVPAQSGLAFVLVQHLDPEHVSLLGEILQRASSIPVVEATDQMQVDADRVYIIPPNRDMAIFHGKLQLSLPEKPRGLRMPIDAFLRSLAEDQGANAIGIILSGTGTDGTLGLRAILGAGGITLAQEPTSAKYDGMPSSAIRAGYVTQVLVVEDMPRALLDNLNHTTKFQLTLPTESRNMSGMNRILMLLRTTTGHDFSQYKKSTIGRRIERRMMQHGIEDTEHYARYLKDNPLEIQFLFKELLINVTNFFRDPEAFKILKQDILLKMIQDKPDDYVFRIWVAGCASGEEAYSIAILLREIIDENNRMLKFQIYATDLDDEAIAVARAGLYPLNIAQDVEPERLRRFFLNDEAGYRIKNEIREMMVFAIQNVIKDPPFTRLDLLSCRNLMIYLEPEVQNRLLPSFHYALKPDGILFLSPSESIGDYVELFTVENRKWKFYRATHSVASTRSVMTSGMPWAMDGGSKVNTESVKKTKIPNFAELTRHMLLQYYAPASVVTDLKANILYVYGDTGKYLRPSPGQASLNVIDMAREGLQIELRAAMQAAQAGLPTLGQHVAIKFNGEILSVNFSVRHVPNPDSGETMLILSFQDQLNTDVLKPKRDKRKPNTQQPEPNESLERELAYTRVSLQATIEAQQASNEELRCANEEMQSTNEELQSTNEELETSKEELQSINEELVTVNSELQIKIEQLAGMQNDMKNLLDNINVGTIFLDERLVIRRYSRDAVKIYHLIATDIGRPLVDIKSTLEHDELIAKAQAVLDNLVPYECEIRSENGTWYQAHIQPYRTLDNIIKGVVLIFTDISARVAADIAGQRARELAEGIVNTIRESLLVLDGDLTIVSASRWFYREFKVTPEDTLGRPIYELGNRQWNIPQLRELLETILPRDQSFNAYRVEHEFPGIGRRRMLLNARRIESDNGQADFILLAIQDLDKVVHSDSVDA
ncbi:MAG: PAS domain-containing protein [Gammaproteobacteria bacterium]|nr:PAS domain-containing protein [Gammaproteobacteria bacterium]